MKLPTLPAGTGFVVVAVASVVAALGVIQVEVQGLTQHTRELTGIRTIDPLSAAAARARAGLGANGSQSIGTRRTAAQDDQDAFLPVGNVSLAK